MCAIVGLIDFDGMPSAAAVERAAERLRKRGPDSVGSWSGGPAAFAHQRLSVIDLSDRGQQPMASADGRFVIVYNGEIYNYRELRAQLQAPAYGWRSDTDTEVILAAYEQWGSDFLTRLHGMFAFAIWDDQEKILFAARDRMGVKPFYYRAVGNSLAFASRPRSLWTIEPSASKEIDVSALRLYLECGYIPAPHSIFASIRKLQPAHYLSFGRNGLRVQRYWDFRHIEPEHSWAARPEADMLDELDEILSRCVRQRMVSDVPIGAFLSGGIDSSLVVALMQKYSSGPVQTFTIGFDDPTYDESGHAQAVARSLETTHHCESLKVDGLLELMPAFREEFDEPFYDSSAFPAMAVARCARRSVTVSLSGDGGDELFGGYHYYQAVDKLRPLFAAPLGVRRLLASVAAKAPGHRAKLMAGVFRQSDLDGVFAFARSIRKDYENVLYPDAICATRGFDEFYRAAAAGFAAGLTPSESGMRFDAGYTLPDDYLQKVDIATMSFSLEAREPLLDQDLVEWAMRLPLSWKLRGPVNKYLLRQLAYRYVPRRLLERPKRGFSVPIDRWLRGPLAAWACEILHDRTLFRDLPLDQDRVLALFDLHASGKRNVHPLLWAILMLLGFWSFHRLDAGA